MDVTQIESVIVNNLTHGKPALSDLAAEDTFNLLAALTNLRDNKTIAREPDESGGNYALVNRTPPT